jgi:cytochrome b subunit of formate dehydrogenase
MLPFTSIFWAAVCFLAVFAIHGVVRWFQRLLATQEKIAAALEILARKPEDPAQR